MRREDVVHLHATHLAHGATDHVGRRERGERPTERVDETIAFVAIDVGDLFGDVVGDRTQLRLMRREIAVARLQLFGHAIEVLGEHGDLAAVDDGAAMREVAVADQLRVRRELYERRDRPLRRVIRDQHREREDHEADAEFGQQPVADRRDRDFDRFTDDRRDLETRRHGVARQSDLAVDAGLLGRTGLFREDRLDPIRIRYRLRDPERRVDRTREHDPVAIDDRDEGAVGDASALVELRDQVLEARRHRDDTDQTSVEVVDRSRERQDVDAGRARQDGALHRQIVTRDHVLEVGAIGDVDALGDGTPVERTEVRAGRRPDADLVHGFRQMRAHCLERRVQRTAVVDVRAEDLCGRLEESVHLAAIIVESRGHQHRVPFRAVVGVRLLDRGLLGRGPHDVAEERQAEGHDDQPETPAQVQPLEAVTDEPCPHQRARALPPTRWEGLRRRGRDGAHAAEGCRGLRRSSAANGRATVGRSWRPTVGVRTGGMPSARGHVYTVGYRRSARFLE